MSGAHRSWWRGGWLLLGLLAVAGLAGCQQSEGQPQAGMRNP